MTGEALRQIRRRMGWTQHRAAKRLGVSQPYLAMVECGQRRVSQKLMAKLIRSYDVPPTALPTREVTDGPLDPDALAAALGALGYPGFAHLGHNVSLTNPATVLLQALRQPVLEPRLTRALPWLVFQYPEIDWDWVVPRVKVQDLQNRLGFVVTLGRRLAERRQDPGKATALSRVEALLEPARLVKEDTFCRDSLSDAERRWLRERRPDDARHWNVLTAVDAEHVAEAAA